MPARLLSVKHETQIEDAGCLATCAQMALAHLAIPSSQGQLNKLFQLSPAGVPLSRLRRLEKNYPARVSIAEGDTSQLFESIDQGIPLILFVRTNQLSYWEFDTRHAVLLVGYDNDDLLVNDPAFSDAPQRASVEEVMLAWEEFNYTYARFERE